MKNTVIILLSTLSLLGCEKKQETVTYDSAEVVRRDIVVAVEAAGVVEPYLTVEVKSKASGEILRITRETGDMLEKGELLVEIDKRSPNNQLAQAKAELEAAIARRSIAQAQTKRSKTLLDSRTINDVDYEQTILEFANAKAEVIRSQVSVENARIALDDTAVRAPITGTIIEKLVETGQVISSPTQDVGGGTLLLKMADLSSVQVKALVDETDIGKIQPGQPVTVTVAAYPNQPFAGSVAKIEPMATADQTVTTFAVLIILDNESGLLRPGMNADVEIRIAERRDVLAVRTGALRINRDIAVSSQLLGIPEDDIRKGLAATKSQTGETAKNRNATGAPEASPGRAAGATRDASRRRSAAGRPGASRSRSGSRSRGAARGQSASGYRFASQYWVFVDDPDGPKPVSIDTGLTDLDYSEVLSGLDAGDRVLLLPSSGLIQEQLRRQARMQQWTTIPGMGGSTNSSTTRTR